MTYREFIFDRAPDELCNPDTPDPPAPAPTRVSHRLPSVPGKNLKGGVVVAGGRKRGRRRINSLTDKRHRTPASSQCPEAPHLGAGSTGVIAWLRGSGSWSLLGGGASLSPEPAGTVPRSWAEFSDYHPPSAEGISRC